MVFCWAESVGPFETSDALDAWYSAPEYPPLIALRKQCTSDLDMMFMLEGA